MRPPEAPVAPTRAAAWPELRCACTPCVGAGTLGGPPRAWPQTGDVHRGLLQVAALLAVSRSGRGQEVPRDLYQVFLLPSPSPDLCYFYLLVIIVLRKSRGIPGWRSGLAPAFGPGRDPGDPGLSPTLGSLQGACFSLPVLLPLSLSLMNK